jgi:hypothetical protein
MSTLCPNGHHSNDAEWCDTCGAPLAGGTGAGSTTAGSATAASSIAPTALSAPSAPASSATINCVSCGEINPESNLFCETCGLDFVTGQKPAESAPVVAAPINGVATQLPADPGEDLGWSATLTVDSEWFAAKGEGIGTPPTRAVEVVELRHHSVVIGRSRSSGHNPGLVIDDDHGISRKHAELTYDADADSWSIIDLGSTNGTFVVANGEALIAGLTPIDPNTARPLQPTDRIFVGAWTRIDLIRPSTI